MIKQSLLLIGIVAALGFMPGCRSANSRGAGLKEVPTAPGAPRPKVDMAALDKLIAQVEASSDNLPGGLYQKVRDFLLPVLVQGDRDRTDVLVEIYGEALGRELSNSVDLSSDGSYYVFSMIGHQIMMAGKSGVLELLKPVRVYAAPAG